MARVVLPSRLESSCNCLFGILDVERPCPFDDSFRKLERNEMKKKNKSKKLKSPRFKSVEEYLASVDPTKERTLRSVIDLILAEFPEVESKISWNMPTIHRKGRYVAGICAYKHHLTFAPW